MSHSHEEYNRQDMHPHHQHRCCSRSGASVPARPKRSCEDARPTGRLKHGWLCWLLPIAGLLSLAWFLIRVIPKPSRAMYPCQRVAMPLASGFVAWLVGLVGSLLVGFPNVT